MSVKGHINKVTKKGKMNGAVKNHVLVLQALIKAGAPYKVSEDEKVIRVEGSEFITKPFDLRGGDAETRFKAEILKPGKLISYKTGVISTDGVLTLGTFACKALDGLKKGYSAVMCHEGEPREKTAKPSVLDADFSLDL